MAFSLRGQACVVSWGSIYLELENRESVGQELSRMSAQCPADTVVERGETCLIFAGQLADQLIGFVKGAELGSSASLNIWMDGLVGYLTSCLKR